MKNIMEKRYKEIQEMAEAYASHMTSDKDMQVAFADALRRGAEWADRTMIDNACKWLKDYAHIYVSETTGDLTEDELINAFRKAMKGE